MVKVLGLCCVSIELLTAAFLNGAIGTGRANKQEMLLAAFYECVTPAGLSTGCTLLVTWASEEKKQSLRSKQRGDVPPRGSACYQLYMQEETTSVGFVSCESVFYSYDSK